MPEPKDPDAGRRRAAVDAWLARALKDLETGQILVGQDPERVDASSVAFFAQQAIENAIKALLLNERVRFPPSHDIGMLRGLLPEATRSLVDERAADIGMYATGPRYPASLADPTDLTQNVDRDEAHHALAIAESVVTAATIAARRSAGPDDGTDGEGPALPLTSL